jgi:uncharacterized protein
MLAVIGSLVIGCVLGFLGQRSRMCFIGGFRDFLMIRDQELLKGAIAFFGSAWLTIVLLNAIGTPVKYVAYPSLFSAVFSKFGVISLSGGLGLGLFSTLAGGCPLRQHVMAGQGRTDATVYLSGFYLGIILYYLVIVEWIAKVL